MSSGVSSKLHPIDVRFIKNKNDHLLRSEERLIIRAAGLEDQHSPEIEMRMSGPTEDLKLQV